MRIGLVDVDGHNFPNLALMKISAYHKAKRDHVEWALPMLGYDTVYQSKVFTFSPDFDTCISCDNIVEGGTGYDLQNKLPDEIESIYPDYSLYGEKKAYGFLTRGCPMNCPFCVVGKKEGLMSRQVSDLRQFYNGQKEIKLCDPNTLACTDKLNILQQLIDSNAWVDFTQGLDIRLTTDDVIDKIKRIKLKMVHFAWDRDNQSDLIIRNLSAFKKSTGMNYRKTAVYVLTNYETEFEFDLYRVYKLKELGYDPYIMIYNKQDAPKKVRHLQRWVNNKIVFRSCEKFEDFDSKRA